MTKRAIRKILKSIQQVKIALYGDFCVDAYWIMQPGSSEISVETGLQADAVKKHYYSPGGASNVAANLAVLNPAMIKTIGVIGNDIYGRELKSLLDNLQIDNTCLITQENNFDTYTFIKRYVDEKEEPRMDFGVFNERSLDTDDLILNHMREALDECDALIFNQQIPGSINNQYFIDGFNQIVSEYPDKLIIFDSRHYHEKFQRLYRKMNEREVAEMNGIKLSPNAQMALDYLKIFGENIYEKGLKPVFITCGERGVLYIDSSGSHFIRGLHLPEPLDPVGAGDTMLSALTLCLAAGLSPSEAVEFAILAAAVTVQKLRTTGTASGDEILDLADKTYRIYNSDLAKDPDRAHYLEGTRLEYCESISRIRNYSVRYAIFNHNGIHTLQKEGTEEVADTPTAVEGDSGTIQVEYDPETQVLPGVMEFLKELQDKGVLLFLVSEKEQGFIEREAGMLNYAEFFKGGLYGVRDRQKENGREKMIRNIIKKHKIKKMELMVIGNDAAGIRECRKYGGLAVGFVTGNKGAEKIDLSNRETLIKAGADLILNNYNDHSHLTNLIFQKKEDQ